MTFTDCWDERYIRAAAPETDELVGIWPSNGGHHDCVIIPTQLEHMKHTRSCTL